MHWRTFDFPIHGRKVTPPALPGVVDTVEVKPMNDQSFFRSVRIFKGITTEAMDRILAQGEEIQAAVNDVILEESSQSADLFLIIEGRVTIEIEAVDMESGQRKKMRLTTLRSGEAFGEIAFLQGKRRSAQVQAIDNARILKIDGEKLSDVLQSDYQTGYLLMRNLALVLAQRLEDINFLWRDNIRPIS